MQRKERVLDNWHCVGQEPRVFHAASIELFSMHRQTIAVQSTPIHEHTVHQAAGAVDVVGDFRKF